MKASIRYVRKVRFSDIDCQGHVFNANYFVYFDDAITDYLEGVGLSNAQLVERGHDVVLARAECDYRSSGQLGESLVTSAGLERIGTTSFTFILEITEERTGRVIAHGKEVYVTVERSSGKPITLPDYVRSALRGERPNQAP